jgi:hypothetical protein
LRETQFFLFQRFTFLVPRILRRKTRFQQVAVRKNKAGRCRLEAAGVRSRFSPGKTKRRGGSGCGNIGAFPRTRSRGIGRVGPSGSKITRARNQKRPGTSGGGRKQEGEALNRTPSVGIRPWAVCKRGSAHEPPPENVASACGVVGTLNRRQVRA